jgi:serine/threonine protein kinase
MDAKQIRDFENECEIMRCPSLSLFTSTHRTHPHTIAHTHTRTHAHAHARATTHLCHRGDSKARSPYILYFYGSCVEPQVCIVVEYCMRGSLYEVMSEETFNLTWERSLRVRSFPPSHLQLHLRCSVLHRSRHCGHVTVGEGAGHGHQLPAQVRSYTPSCCNSLRVHLVSRA